MAGAGSTKTIAVTEVKIGDRVRVRRIETDTGAVFLDASNLRDSANATVVGVRNHTVDREHIARGHSGRPYRITVAIDGCTDPLTQYFAGYSAIMRAREDKP